MSFNSVYCISTKIKLKKLIFGSVHSIVTINLKFYTCYHATKIHYVRHKHEEFANFSSSTCIDS